MGMFDFLRSEKAETIWRVNGQELTPNLEQQAYLHLGVEKYNLGNFVEAASAFSEAINLTPTIAALYTMRGTAYEDYNNIRAAESDFAQALEIDPTDYLAAYRLGMIYHDRQDRTNAIKYLQQAYENQILDLPNVPHMGWSKNCLFFVGKQIISHNLALQFIEIGSPHEAIIYFEHSARVAPDYANAHFGLGAANLNLGRDNEAIRHFTKAAKLGHTNAMQLLSDNGIKY